MVPKSCESPVLALEHVSGTTQTAAWYHFAPYDPKYTTGPPGAPAITKHEGKGLAK